MQADYLLLGGDARQSALARLLAKEHSVRTLCVPGLPDCDGEARDLVLPIPSVLPDGTPRVLSWKALAARVGPGSRVYGVGLKDHAAALTAAGAQTVELLADPEVRAQNARLTAEAALLLVMQHTGRALLHRHCLVLGFGRIGQCLARLLAAHGAAVTVVSASAEKIALARALGDTACTPAQLSACEDALLFNTAPAQLVSTQALLALGPDCLWVELASAPGGLPEDTALPFGVLAAGGLPGKWLPVSAAALLYHKIVSSHFENRVN